jgi:NAD(P) transhydrogenase subunit alpha
MEFVDPIIFRLTIFVLAIFVGYFVVWSVTPALHTPLMSVTNAISSVIIVGALIAVSVTAHPTPENAPVTIVDHNASVMQNSQRAAGTDINRQFNEVANEAMAAGRQLSWHAMTSKGLGFFALILASVNIFGGFLVTARMLAMYKKKAKK